MHPAGSSRGVTYVLADGTVVTKTAVPLHRHRMPPKPTPEQIARVFNEHADSMHIATLGSRSIPFGGTIVVLQGIAFTTGTDITLPHRLTAKAILLLLAQPRAFVAASGSATAYVKSVDDANITLHALGSFVADVVLGVGP